MYIKKTKTSTGRVFLQIVEGYRSENGKSTNRVIQKLGYQDELDPVYQGDAFSYFKEKLASSSDADILSSAITFKGRKTLEIGKSSLKNVGYLAFKPIYEKLGFKKVCQALSTKYKSTEDINEILQFLLYSKIIDNARNFSSFSQKEKYFEDYQFSEEQMYKTISYIGNSWEKIKDYIFKTTNEAYGLDLSRTFYNANNFYFEINFDSNSKNIEHSTETREEPLARVGLLLDANYIPVDIYITRSNESKRIHFSKILRTMKDKNKLTGRTIYIAEKDPNYANNVYSAIKNGNGYIYSHTIKSAPRKIQNFIEENYVLKENYSHDGNIEHIIKDFISYDASLIYLDKKGQKAKHTCTQKQIVSWSTKYARITKIKREKLINVARLVIKTPTSWEKSRIGDAADYIKKITYDKHGLIVIDKSELELNIDKIVGEEHLDGYYLIVTSEIAMSAEEIVKTYRNLLNIEIALKVQQIYKNLRSVHIMRQERINAHVLISYLSLLILRILEHKVLKDAFPINTIVASLREYECAMISPNVYFFFTYNSVVEALGNVSSSCVTLETQSLSGVKSLFKNY